MELAQPLVIGFIEVIVELLFELVFGGLLELIVEGVAWLFSGRDRRQGDLDETARTDVAAHRAERQPSTGQQRIVDALMLSTAALAGLGWGWYVAGTGKESLPAAVFSLGFMAVVFGLAAVLKLHSPRSWWRDAGDAWSRLLVFGPSRFWRLSLISAAGSLATLTGFLLA